ncbi:MAG: type II toxin-antitoxin system RelE/ParE family toxin [Candidatus Aureabacteria bacterium]|nr:type II toxin-antitoxin system RelE/ParE family toxin [Candidatus Auribacterota bacterium]
MAKYNISIKKSAVKELENIPKKHLQKIVKKIQSLSNNPRPQGSQKLSHKEQYRMRQGDYRIVYSVQDKEQSIVIVKVGHRKEVYRSN